MPRSPRSTRPRSGRLGRSRPAGLPTSAPHESSSRLLFTARQAPVSAVDAPEPADEAEPEVVLASTPAPTVPPPATRETAPPPPAAEPTVDLPADGPSGPATRVHAHRLEAASPKLTLTPSQAVHLASDGRDVLTRARPRAS